MRVLSSYRQLEHQQLLRAGVHKLRPIVDRDKGPAADASLSDGGSLLSRARRRPHASSEDPKEGGDRAAFRHDGSDSVPPACESADAVERLLSADEVEEFAEMPTLPGTYFDRRTQTLRLSSRQRASNWTVNTSLSLNQLVAQCKSNEEKCQQRLEEKGHVSERVIRRIQQREAQRRRAQEANV